MHRSFSLFLCGALAAAALTALGTAVAVEAGVGAVADAGAVPSEVSAAAARAPHRMSDKERCTVSPLIRSGR